MLKALIALIPEKENYTIHEKEKLRKRRNDEKEPRNGINDDVY